MDFGIWELLIALLCLGAFLGAVLYYRDTLHPFAFLAPMIVFIYVYLPGDAACKSLLELFFSDWDVHFVKAVTLLFLAALFIGCCFGSRERPGKFRVREKLQSISTMNPSEANRITTIGVILGTVALMAYGLNISLQGGFGAAYSEAKGGGAAADSGYLRDPAFWSISASLLLLFGAQKVRRPIWNYAGTALFITPMLLQGILASRRGPMFMGLVALGAGWYLSRGKRPGILTLLVGGSSIGFLLLFFLAFRGEIHLGSDILSRISFADIQKEVDEKLSKETTGNEAFYSANVILSSRAYDRHFWGRRYAGIVFVRPIPKQWWPTKYDDVGLSDYLINAGLGFGDQLLVEAPPGAAPGFVADLYVEFAFVGGILACGIVGWYFGWSWRKAREGYSFAIINYGCLAAFSIFFVAQNMEAILSRYLVVIIPTGLLWYFIVTPSRSVDSPKKSLRTGSTNTSGIEQPGI